MKENIWDILTIKLSSSTMDKKRRWYIIEIELKKSFKAKIERDPSRETTIMTIEDICEKVNDGKIVMPIFQTGLRWTEEKMRDLLSFQLIGFAAVAPISMCYLDFGFELNNEIYQKYGSQIELLTREKLSNIRGEVYSLTDGQQRVTTNYKCYIGHSDLKNYMVDLNVGKIVIINDYELPKEGQIPVGVLYNKDFNLFSQYINEHKELQHSSLSTYLSLIRTKFLGYRYTVNLAKNLTEKQQMEWFEILNNAGSKIPLKEMRLSRLKIKDVDYHNEYISKFVQLIRNMGYGEAFTSKATQVSYPLAALNPAYDYLFSKINTKKIAPIASDVKEVRICALESQQLKDLFIMTLNALELTLEFIYDNKLDICNRMEYITFAMGYFVYGNNEKLTEARKQYLISWFNTIEFTNMTNSRKREEYYRLIYMIKMDNTAIS